jgi:hypothetical protein
MNNIPQGKVAVKQSWLNEQMADLADIFGLVSDDGMVLIDEGVPTWRARSLYDLDGTCYDLDTPLPLK